jgi:hypothetical protein
MAPKPLHPDFVAFLVLGAVAYLFAWITLISKHAIKWTIAIMVVVLLLVWAVSDGHTQRYPTGQQYTERGDKQFWMDRLEPDNPLHHDFDRFQKYVDKYGNGHGWTIEDTHRQYKGHGFYDEDLLRRMGQPDPFRGRP